MLDTDKAIAGLEKSRGEYMRVAAEALLAIPAGIGLLLTIKRLIVMSHDADRGVTEWAIQFMYGHVLTALLEIIQAQERSVALIMTAGHKAVLTGDYEAATRLHHEELYLMRDRDAILAEMRRLRNV